MLFRTGYPLIVSLVPDLDLTFYSIEMRLLVSTVSGGVFVIVTLFPNYVLPSHV